MSSMPCPIFAIGNRRPPKALVLGAISVAADWNWRPLPGTLMRRGRCRAAYQQQGVPDMPHLKLFRLVGAVVVLTGMPLLAASAQTQAPTPPSPSASPPEATKPDAGPTTPSPPKNRPTNP